MSRDKIKPFVLPPGAFPRRPPVVNPDDLGPFTVPPRVLQQRPDIEDAKRRALSERDERVARGCIKDAQNKLGNGWCHVSADMQKALVLSYAVAVFRAHAKHCADAAIRVEYFDGVIEAIERLLA